MEKTGSNQRDKRQSKQKLLDAVGKIIVRDGFKGVGINSVAKEAELDKVLIYRYFDGLEGLLQAFAKRKDFYITASDAFQEAIEQAEKKELKSLIVKILVDQLRELLGNRELQEIMLWEMIERNELTLSIAKEREEKGLEITKKLKMKMDEKRDGSAAVIALLVSGIYYLVLRSRTVDVFNGISLNSEEGWQRIEDAIGLIVDSYFN